MRMLLFLACCLVLPWGVVTADEKADRAVLEAFRARGEFASALDAIKSLARKDDAAPWLEYERGLTLLAQAQAEKNDPKKHEQLVAAEAAFEQYLAHSPGGRAEIDGHSQLGMVNVQRARQLMRNAEDSPEAVRPNLLAAAREHYEKSVKRNELIVRSCTTLLETPEVKANATESDEIRKQQLQGRLLVAAGTEELAEALTAGSPEYQAAIEKAEKEYADIYVKYRTRLAGLYARMYQARCLQKLMKHAQVVPMFDEILAVPDMPEPFRTLKIKALELAADSWLATEKYETLVERVHPFLKSLRPAEEKMGEIDALRKKLAAAQNAIALRK